MQGRLRINFGPALVRIEEDFEPKCGLPWTVFSGLWLEIRPTLCQHGYQKNQVWAGCDCYPPFYAGFEADYGTPVKDYAETAAGSGVFAREWTKADVSFDCNVGKANITMK